MKDFRDKYGWTQKEVAEKLGISIDYVSMLERNIRTPGFFLAKKVADLFGCKIEDIFFGDVDYKTSDDEQATTTA
jgi:putative transcriptional regulator